MAKDKELHPHVVSYFKSKLQRAESLKDPKEQTVIEDSHAQAHVSSDVKAAKAEFESFIARTKASINPPAWERVKQEFEDALETI